MTDITLEQRARELLAAEYERDSCNWLVWSIVNSPVENLTVDMGRALRAIEAALRLSAGADWVLVPREPTEAMYAAAVERIKQNTVIIDDGPAKGATLVRDRPGHLWAAMLAAAPRHETGESDV